MEILTIQYASLTYLPCRQLHELKNKIKCQGKCSHEAGGYAAVSVTPFACDVAAPIISRNQHDTNKKDGFLQELL
uniref:Uncharacterized protein n=1 Tax=Arundo donax TaxID=35708 RepID=A0A0A9GF60_ARUDO